MWHISCGSHADRTARFQTVDEHSHPDGWLYHVLTAGILVMAYQLWPEMDGCTTSSPQARSAPCTPHRAAPRRATPRHAALRCATPCCIVPRHAAPHHATLRCAMPCRAALCHSTLRCATPRRAASRRAALCHATLRCATPRCAAPLHVTFATPRHATPRHASPFSRQSGSDAAIQSWPTRRSILVGNRF